MVDTDVVLGIVILPDAGVLVMTFFGPEVDSGIICFRPLNLDLVVYMDLWIALICVRMFVWSFLNRPLDRSLSAGLVMTACDYVLRSRG